MYLSATATIGMAPAHRSGWAKAMSQAASPPIEWPERNTRSVSIENRRQALTVDFEIRLLARGGQDPALAKRPDLTLFAGQQLEYTVTNRSGKDIYFAILDLSSDGSVDVLYPAEGRALVLVNKDSRKGTATAALAADPGDAQASDMLATLLFGQREKKPENQPPAIFEYARVGLYEGAGAVDPTVRKERLARAQRYYKFYHGSDEGWDKLAESAKANALPPSPFGSRAGSRIRA